MVMITVREEFMPVLVLMEDFNFLWKNNNFWFSYL